MKKFMLLLLPLVIFSSAHSQIPCNSNPVYRQFDFWIGEWEVYAKNGKKAGDSKIDLILDSCVILENWKSATSFNGIFYSGKSFNEYNSATKQWQETWVDNVGGITEYPEGHYVDNSMIFQTKPFEFKKDTIAIRRLSFTKLDVDKVRQHGEITKDNGNTWVTEYDLEYRRKKQ
jgi:hypothetical protein